MSQNLGKIEKPSVEGFGMGRKLYFVPLVFSPRDPEDDLLGIIKRYWEQVEAHVSNLEEKLGNVRKIYHELVPEGGEDGAEAIEELDEGSYKIVKVRLDKGAELQSIEDAELLTEFMDWSRCLAIGLQNDKVFIKVFEFYTEAQKKRNDYLSKSVDDTLEDGEIGMLLMREGHQVQFPPDIEVFYIAPPGLDEIKRWLRAREAETQSGSS